MKMERFRILANMVSTKSEGRELFEKSYRVTDKFLDVTLDYIGSISFDEMLRKSVKAQKAVIEAYPSFGTKLHRSEVM